MISPATSWLEMVELLVVDKTTIPMGTRRHKGISTHNTPQVIYFDKSSAMISTLVNKTWFSWYPCCQQMVYDNGSEFKLHCEALYDTYGIKRKPTSIKNPQANAILERVHQVIMVMLHTAEIDTTNSVDASDIDTFLTNVAWVICSTYHTVLKASPGAAIFGRDMLINIPFLADWNKIVDYRQHQTDLNTQHENRTRKDWDYKVSYKVMLRKDIILHKSESHYECDPWTITSVHTNGIFRL